MSTTDLEVQSWFKRTWVALRDQYNALLPNQKSYVNAVVLFALFIVVRPFHPALGDLLFWLSVLAWAMAFGSDLSDFYGRFSESAFGKLCLVVLVGGGINLSITLASQTVNKLIGINPGSFVHTIAFVALFEGLALGLLLLAVLFVVALVLGFIFLMLHWASDERFVHFFFPWYRPRSDVPFKKLTATVQILSFLTLCGFAMEWVRAEQPSYRAFVEEKARWFLYRFEMYDRAPCALGEGQRVAFLDEDQVLLATRVEEATTFEVKSCVAGG